MRNFIFSLPFFLFIIPVSIFSSQAQVSNDSIDALNSFYRKQIDAAENVEAAIRAEKAICIRSEKSQYRRGAAQALNNIGVAFYNMEKSDSALLYHTRALDLRQKLGDKSAIAASYMNIGNAYDGMGNRTSALNYYSWALDLRKEIGDTIALARSNMNFGAFYLSVPDYYKSWQYSHEAARLLEILHKRNSELAMAYNNMGKAYEGMNDRENQIMCFGKSLEIQVELNEDKSEIAKLLDNLAAAYLSQAQETTDEKLRRKNLGTAIENDYKAIRLYEELDTRSGIITAENNLGNIYWELNDYPQALIHLKKALKTSQELGMKLETSFSLNSLAKHYLRQKQYREAIPYSVQALKLAEEEKSDEEICSASQILSDCYNGLKEFDKALMYYKKYSVANEAHSNLEGARKVAREESKLEMEKHEQAMKHEQERERQIAEERSRRQKLIIWSVACGLLLVAAFAGFIFRSLRITRSQKILIEKQKEEVDKQRELADSRRVIAEDQKNVIEIQKTEVEKAKKIIEEHNKDITDSINYAQRIQRAVLPHRRDILAAFPESFVLFRPKDIVSGDFYWANPGEEIFSIGCCDSTGHGVPGAFMSLLNISFLNQAAKEKFIVEPDKILNDVRLGIVKALNPDGSEDRKDGMDAVLCCIDRKNKILYASCANNPIWYIRSGELYEIKPDKMPVGSHELMANPFTKHTVQMQEGDSVYLFTDGLADQFGGPKNKKFRYKQFEELLLSNVLFPMKLQKDIIEKTFLDWKGTCEQVDDVLVIGIRI